VTGLSLLQLFGIPVVVRKRFVHLTNVESMAICDPIGTLTRLLNDSVELSNRHPTPFEMGLVVDARLVCGDDPVRRHCHARS
jgi:hypothetical protein